MQNHLLQISYNIVPLCFCSLDNLRNKRAIEDTPTYGKAPAFGDFEKQYVNSDSDDESDSSESRTYNFKDEASCEGDSFDTKPCRVALCG